jgi:RNA-directed DNA polymerase
MGRRSSVNTGVPWPGLELALPRVLSMQSKLHRWATADPGRRFDDVFNLVADPAFMVVAWDRVRGNKGGRTAGVDGIAPRSLSDAEVREMLSELREELKARSFVPCRVREKSIPKAGGKVRRLGIPTVAA